MLRNGHLPNKKAEKKLKSLKRIMVIQIHFELN
jgi:hypothetical protein